jgi:ribosomal protein S12 methylthiotransferase
MTVEQFDPQATKKSSNSAESQTTTLDIPSKMIEQQVNSQQPSKAAKIGFVSLGCLKAKGQSKLQPLFCNTYYKYTSFHVI